MPDSVHDRPSCVIHCSLPQPNALHRDGGFASATCPDCGKHSLKRIRRRSVDRFMSTVVASRRFLHAAIRGAIGRGTLQAIPLVTG